MKLWLSDASDCVYTLYVFCKEASYGLSKCGGKNPAQHFKQALSRI